jgi:hypothetical protein
MKAIRLNTSTYDEAVRAVARYIRPRLFIVQVGHDDGCEAIASQRDADRHPPCRPDFWLVEPLGKARAR